MDCDEHKSVCTKYGVSGYPTIQWFPKGSLEPKKYEFSVLICVFPKVSLGFHCMMGIIFLENYVNAEENLLFAYY